MNLVDELHEIAGALTTAGIRYAVCGGIDLLIAESAFEGMLSDRVEIALPQGPLAVVPLQVLLRMKRLAGRPQDIADIEKLEHGDEP